LGNQSFNNKTFRRTEISEGAPDILVLLVVLLVLPLGEVWRRRSLNQKHNSAFVTVGYYRGDRGTGEVPMFARVRAEILFLAAGSILVVGIAYLF
jgi:hypothetical protein